MRVQLQSAAIVICIWVLSVAIRALTAGWGGLSSEECICANIAASAGWSKMLALVRMDGNPPLLYVLIKTWAGIFGDSDLSLRCFAVLAASILPPVAYLTFRKQLCARSALVFAILLATCAPLVRFGDLVRGYGLLPLLTLLSTNELINLLRKPSKQRQITYTVLLAALLYLHHWGAVVLAGQTLLALIGTKQKYWSTNALKRWSVSVVIASLTYLPWFIHLSEQLGRDIGPWIQKPSLQEFFFNTAIEAVSGYIEQPPWLFDLIGLIANICVWTSLVTSNVFSNDAAGSTSNRLNVRHWQFFCAGGLLAALAVSQMHSIWRDRYLVAFTPALLLLQVAATERLTVRLNRQLPLLLPLIVWLPIWIPQLVSFAVLPESTAWALAPELTKSVDLKNAIIVTPFATISPQLHRYLPAPVTVIAYPDLERMPSVRWTSLSSLIKSDEPLDKLLRMLADETGKGKTIWFIEFAGALKSKCPTGQIAQMDYRSAELFRSIQIRTWLQEHCRQQGKPLYAPGRESAVVAEKFVPLRNTTEAFPSP